MNTRMRQKIKAMRLLMVQPIMALLTHDGSPIKEIIFIDPRDWDEAKAMYGDKLQKFLEDRP